MTELGGFNKVASVTRYDTATDGLIAYTANSAGDFSLVPGQAYQVQTRSGTAPTGIDFTPAHY